MKSKTLILGAIFTIVTLGGCNNSTPSSIGVHNQKLSSCPSSPNCVSSDAEDQKHHIPPFQLNGDVAAGWNGVYEEVGEIPRNIVTSQSGNYLHAEIQSRVFRFIDDLELLLNPLTGSISVRSASRTGSSDFGVNRKRVETLRKKLIEKKIIKN